MCFFRLFIYWLETAIQHVAYVRECLRIGTMLEISMSKRVNAAITTFVEYFVLVSLWRFVFTRRHSHLTTDVNVLCDIK